MKQSSDMIESDPLHQAKILVIDDEPMNLQILADILTTEGYANIVCEEDPVHAISLYQRQSFDLVLLDLNMPKKTGFEVMDIFKDLAIKLPPPVLILTALNDSRTKMKALTSGANDFVTKPFDYEEIVSRVNNLVRLQQTIKQLYNNNENLESKVEEQARQIEAMSLAAVRRLDS